MSELLAGIALSTLRWIPALAVQPLWQRAVGPLWWPLAVGLAVVLSLGGPRPELVALEPQAWVRLGLMELLLGLGVGLAAAIPGFALLGASTVVSRGLDVASSGWAALWAFISLALALTLGLHRAALLAFEVLAQRFPVGAPALWAPLGGELRGLLALGHALLHLGLSFVTPALLSLAVVDAITRWVSVGEDADSAVDAVRIWARAFVALVALTASWMAWGERWAHAMLPG